MITEPNAKVNIGLDVLRKRPDGYHDLESLFVPCFNFRDTLEITEAPKFSVDIDFGNAAPWDPMSDLTVKAYRLLCKDFQLPKVRISLTKRIPVGAGLGGGSADGAFALRMMSEMFDLYMPDELLECYAAELGSDCPFFVYNRPMFVSGRGDELEPAEFPALDDYRLEVIVPEGISVSTGTAYKGIVPAVPQLPLREALARPVEEWRDCVKNDFEKTVFEAYPSLAGMKEALYSRGAVYAAMSGSGSALFALWRK